MPDVHVGYFIDPASRVASARDRGEPVRIAGSTSVSVVVFGSDGGGNRFALSSDGGVFYLPSSGAVLDGAFREDAKVRAALKATSLFQFLWMLHGDVEAFVRGDEDHVYLPGRPSLRADPAS